MTRYDIKIKTISIKESVTSLFLNSHDNKISYIPSNSLIMINIPLISSDYFLAQQNYIILKENELNFQVDNINLEFTHKLYFQITQACKAYVINKSVNNSLSKENESDTSFILHFKLNSFTFQESDFGSIILQDVTFDKIKQSFHFKLGKIKSNIIHQTVLCDPTHFIQICFDNNYITIHFSQFDIFLDIEKIIQYISFYKSFKSWFLSLKDVIKPDSNQTNFNDFPMIQCILHDVNLHFPFPDDVLFKEHDLTMSLDLIMNSNNGSLELFVKVSNIYFSAIQSRVKFLPVLSDFSAKLTLKNGHDISIETGPLNIYLSIIDMVELQIIFDNIIRSISPMTTSRSLYYEEKKKSYLHFQYFVVDSISLYLCKENRQSNNYNSLFKILLDSWNVEINDKYIVIQELFSIYHRNFVRSKFDSFLSPTKITLTYDHNNVNTTNFGLIIDNINVDFSTDSLNSIYQIIDEFHNQNDTAMIKHENSTDPEYWIHNNLYDLIKLTCDNEHEFIINSHDHIPIFQIKKDSELNIEISNKNFKIIPKNIIFPLYCDNFSVSLIKYHSSLSIEFSSLLSIKNKLDFPFFIYINTKGSTNFIKYIKLMPGYKHPIFFNENSYIFVTNINSGIKPECYTFSAHSYPNDIKIVTDGMEIKYQIIPKFNSQSNSKVYKIVPTIFIINSIPFSIQNNMIYCQIIQNNSTNNISVKSGEKKPLSFINKNSEKINMALSYSSKFGKSTEIALNPNSLYSYNISLDFEEESYQLAIYIQYLKHQKNIIINVPCVIFNQSSQTIIISPNHRMLPNSILFYGPKTYFEKSKSTNLDITIEGQSIEGKNVIDCKILCPLSKIIYLQSSKYENLLTPINYSNVMGKGKMNLTHIITFTSYLYVINELMYDFFLSPTKMNDSLLKEPFFIGCGQKVLIDWIPNDEKFLFSIFQFSSIPFIYLSRPTKTVFSMINKDQILYVELEIIEKESTLYATFRNPLFPTPFMINNSLKSSIYVSQFDSGRKTQIVESSTSIFAFDQPFLNSQIVIHVNDIIERKYTFSLEEQIAPIVDNDDNKIIIELIVTGQNQKMVFVHYSNQIFGFKQSANFMLSINQIYISLFNRDMREFALLSINKVLVNVKQDNQKSIMTFSTKSIQFDDQSFSPSYPVFLYGPNVGINPFIYVSSIFPRGIPFLSVIEYFNLNIQPIHIFLDMKFIWKLIDFYNSSNKKVKKSDKFPNVLQPAYKSISKNKIHILWAEISSIYASVKVNEEGVKSSIYSFILWTLNLSKGKTIEFPSLFLYNFNNSVSMLQERLVMFYGNSAIDSISKDSVLLYSVYGIVDWLNFVNFEKINFQAIMNTRRDNVNRSIYDNQKIVANYFNGLSLESLLNYLNIYLNEESEIIKSIINGNILYLQIYQFDNCIFGKNISKKVNDAQIVENVERSRNPKVTPILTSNTENLVNLDEIQKNIFKQEPGHRSKIVFFLKSTEHNEYYCITYCKLFTLKNDMSIKSNYNLNQFEILNTNMSSVTLKSSQDDKLINIQLDSAEEVNLFVLFINAQKDFLDIFTNNKNKHDDQYHDE